MAGPFGNEAGSDPGVKRQVSPCLISWGMIREMKWLPAVLAGATRAAPTGCQGVSRKAAKVADSDVGSSCRGNHGPTDEIAATSPTPSSPVSALFVAVSAPGHPGSCAASLSGIPESASG